MRGWCAVFVNGDSRQGNVIENGPINVNGIRVICINFQFEDKYQILLILIDKL